MLVILAGSPGPLENPSGSREPVRTEPTCGGEGTSGVCIPTDSFIGTTALAKTLWTAALTTEAALFFFTANCFILENTRDGSLCETCLQFGLNILEKDTGLFLALCVCPVGFCNLVFCARATTSPSSKGKREPPVAGSARWHCASCHAKLNEFVTEFSTSCVNYLFARRWAPIHACVACVRFLLKNLKRSNFWCSFLPRLFIINNSSSCFSCSSWFKSI